MKNLKRKARFKYKKQDNIVLIPMAQIELAVRKVVFDAEFIRELKRLLSE